MRLWEHVVSTIVYLMYDKNQTQKHKMKKCACLVSCLCLFLWRLSDLQICTGKNGRQVFQYQTTKLQRNVLHLSVLMDFVSVLSLEIRVGDPKSALSLDEKAVGKEKKKQRITSSDPHRDIYAIYTICNV